MLTGRTIAFFDETALDSRSLPGTGANRILAEPSGTQNPILPHPPSQAWFDPPAREFVPYAPRACAAILGQTGSGSVVKLVPVGSP